MKHPKAKTKRTFYAARIDSQVLKKFRVACKSLNVKVQEAIDEALAEWLKKWG